LVFVFFMPEFTVDAARGISGIRDLSHKSGKLGAYRALIIGINNYEDPKIPKLKTAVDDAKDLAQLLSAHYGFQVQLLLNSKATKEAIYQALRNLAISTRSDDSILIYYAGHGDLDRTYHDGWWIPADAKAGSPVTYLDNVQIQISMRNMNARHVLLISDSCYSGTLFGQSRALPRVIDNKYYLNLYNEKSRWGLTSGNKTPVSDAGSGGHSVFAYQLLKELRKNEKPYISIQELCTRIAPIVSNNSEQTPLCRPIRNTGDQGGEFVFVASSDTKENALVTDLTVDHGRLEQEQIELERIKMEKENKNIEDKRKQIEGKSKTLMPKIKREERLQQENTQIESLASVPKTAVSSIEKRYRLAVFPISEIGFAPSDLKNQRKYIDFIIKYTSGIPNIRLTHSFYPHNENYTTQYIMSIRDIINKNIEQKIWHSHSWFSEKKPDLKLLKELSSRINFGLVLIFRIESNVGSYRDNFEYSGYLVDVDNNITFKEINDFEQSSSVTDFTIVEMMTKKLFESYQNSNSRLNTRF